jgi:phosphoribosylformimino-5-aminoimidazole carboxamide ribotide isomerase
MLIYPAIDIYEGKCVRLRQGDFAAQKVYSDSPPDIARSYLENGLDFLHIVDLEGAKKGQIVNRETLRTILGIPGLRVQIGGGIRTREDLTSLFQMGAARVVIGSLAVKSPHIVREWMREFQPERFVIAVDIRQGSVAHAGWLERANLTPSAFIDTMARVGAIRFLCTDIDRDGMLEGPNLELYSSLNCEFPQLQFIASGGVSELADLEKLKTTGCEGVVVGKALFEGRVTTEELARLSGC